MFLHDLEQAQPTPLALGRDLVRLPSQVCACSISLLRVSTRVSQNNGMQVPVRVIHAGKIRGRSGRAAIDARNQNWVHGGCVTVPSGQTLARLGRRWTR
jgi:hypothetical protein